MREIKFQFLYTDGDDWMRRTFNLDEIMNGEPFDVISDSPLLRNYKMVAKRQYTGLKDRDGNGIYEGDLLQNPYSQTCHYVVEWHQSDHGSGWKKTRKNSKTDLGAECETMKVIGNIHQNPELLK